jgi:hypothetical protein
VEDRELVITSDDPTTPVKTLDVMADSIWNECGCKQRCDQMLRRRPRGLLIGPLPRWAIGRN